MSTYNPQPTDVIQVFQMGDGYQETSFVTLEKARKFTVDDWLGLLCLADISDWVYVVDPTQPEIQRKNGFSNIPQEISVSNGQLGLRNLDKALRPGTLKRYFAEIEAEQALLPPEPLNEYKALFGKKHSAEGCAQMYRNKFGFESSVDGCDLSGQPGFWTVTVTLPPRLDHSCVRRYAQQYGAIQP